MRRDGIDARLDQFEQSPPKLVINTGHPQDASRNFVPKRDLTR